MEIFAILEEMSSLLQDAKKVPLSKKVMIERKLLQSLINRMEEEMPADLKEAAQILAQREEIINEAQKQAREEALRLIAESDVVQQAEQRAEAIVKEAQQKSKQIKEGVRDYADGVLEELEDELDDKLREVRKNRARL